MAFWISRPLYLSISTNPVHQDPQLCCSNSPLQGAYKVTEEEPVIHLKYAAGILVASAAFKTIYYRPISMRKRHFEKSCKQKVAAVEKWPRLQQANKSHQCGIRARTLPWLSCCAIRAQCSQAHRHPWQQCCTHRSCARRGCDLSPWITHTYIGIKRNEELSPSLWKATWNINAMKKTGETTHLLGLRAEFISSTLI